MSKALEDVRCKVSVEAKCALAAEAEAIGRKEADVLREIVERWASQRLHALNITQRRLAAEGIAGQARANEGEAAQAGRR